MNILFLIFDGFFEIKNTFYSYFSDFTFVESSEYIRTKLSTTDSKE